MDTNTLTTLKAAVLETAEAESAAFSRYIANDHDVPAQIAWYDAQTEAWRALAAYLAERFPARFEVQDVHIASAKSARALNLDAASIASPIATAMRCAGFSSTAVGVECGSFVLFGCDPVVEFHLSPELSAWATRFCDTGEAEPVTLAMLLDGDGPCIGLATDPEAQPAPTFDTPAAQ